MENSTHFVLGRRARSGALLGVLLLGGGLAIHRISGADEAAKQPGVSVTATPAPRPSLAGRTAALADIENAFTAIADRMEPSMVSIRVTKSIKAPAMGGGNMEEFFWGPGIREFGGQMPQMRRMPQTYRAQGSGSGVIVRPDGWILTNDHVVGGADKVTVKLHDGREFEGTVRRDFRSDLALVKINASGLVPVDFADSDQIKVGQWAVAFGSPFSLDDTMTHGIISARQRQKVISEDGETRFYPSLLQTDASINPGNSGGALVDINGRVIGINVAINSPSGGSVGIGFAIPSNTAREVTEQLIATGKVTRGFLGVAPRALNPNERQRYGVPTGGALIEQVSENTPASRAGFEVEDVVVRYNGQPVASDIAFRELVARTAPGKAVDVVVRRGGKEVTLKVTTEAQKEAAAAADNEAPAKAEGGKLGVQVQTITPDVAKQYNLGSLNAGVLVGGIQPGSPAADAGIQPGDVIVRANGRAVRSAEDLRGAVESLKSGDTATLVIYRSKARTLVSVHIP